MVSYRSFFLRGGSSFFAGEISPWAMNTPSITRTTKTTLSKMLPFHGGTGPNVILVSASSIRLPVLLQVLDRNRVHVGVVLVLSAHAPAEAVVLRPDARMNRPAGRHNDLLIRHHDVAGRIRRPHQ